MHYCSALLITFCGAFEMLILWMEVNDKGALEERIHSTRLTLACFYSCLVFAAVKFITGYLIYRSFRKEYFS